jgi:hypothetical protein
MNHEFKRTGQLYNFGGRINPNATAADLFGAVFEDPDSNGADIHAQVMGTVNDELSLLLDSMSNGDDFDVELGQRVLIRTQHWIKLAGALHDRFEAAEKEPELSEAAE